MDNNPRSTKRDRRAYMRKYRKQQKILENLDAEVDDTLNVDNSGDSNEFEPDIGHSDGGFASADSSRIAHNSDVSSTGLSDGSLILMTQQLLILKRAIILTAV